MKIKKEDTVLISSGKDRGKKGKILQVFPQTNRVIIEGINLRKKHQRPKKSGEKGQIITLPGSVSIANIKLVCSKCGKPSRVGYKIVLNASKENSPVLGKTSKNKKSKIRICRKCGQET